MKHHFEVKVAGGKLVVADIDDDGAHITDARISGDFFLEPEEAFDAINSALIGAPVGASTDELQKLIDDALAPLGDVSLHGFSTRDVASTLR